MSDPKISLITVCYNTKDTIKQCIESVIAQSYTNIEYIIIDGGSTDGTLQIIDQYKQHISFYLSEPDNGIYDALNKGIKNATADIVGALNADDYFTDNNVVAGIAAAFKNHKTDIVYGNLNYIDPNGKVIRKWKSERYQHGKFNWGWMPPHPTFYCKRELFDHFGLYKTEYGTAGDYELMVRFMHKNRVRSYFLNKTLINMNLGGLSNVSYHNRIKAWRFDYKAMRKNGVLFPLVAIIFKPLRKIVQFIT